MTYETLTDYLKRFIAVVRDEHAQQYHKQDCKICAMLKEGEGMASNEMR